MAPPCDPLCQFSERLYFTTFPHPAPSQDTLNKTSRASEDAPVIRSRSRIVPPVSPCDDTPWYWFTLDTQLVYLSFFEDWGPLNIAMVYKACILIHELLEDKELSRHRLVLYSSNDPRKKANAALLMALFVMIVQRRAPWEAFHPIAELEFMPFRDAGRGRSDFNLSIQDCLWGMWKAMQNGLCDMNEFSVADYEFYEKVENGDWNWITPNFIAFASPVDPTWTRKLAAGTVTSTAASPTRVPLPATSGARTALQRKLPTPFLNCLDYFEAKNVKLVIRLNNPLYDKATFEERGVNHLELYFDDGTNPTDEIVRKFIDVCDAIVEQGGVVAVHCKAGLGRTGTLIGAYLIWKYGFTANEAIAFMRIVRPGSVVGPQQQYMYLKQLEWSKWAAVDEMRRIQAAAEASVPVQRPATPPSDSAETKLPPVTPSRHVAAAAAKGAAPPPGQPRKTPMAKRVARDLDDEDDEMALTSRPPAAKQARPTVPRPASTDLQTTRTTRSTTALARKPALATSRPTTAASQRASRPAVTTAVVTTGTRTRAAAAAANPGTPSRLPTLVPSKRSYVLAETTTTTNVKVKASATPADAWIKADRPILRSVRRRRSSFSAAES